MIENRRAESVYTRDWLFDGTAKAFFSDLRNSLIDLVRSHLTLRLVADAGAAHTRLTTGHAVSPAQGPVASRQACRLRRDLNPANHDDDIPTRAALRISLGTLKDFRKAYLA